MDSRTPPLDTLLELDIRQDDLLARLDELDKRVEQVLKEWQTGGRPADSTGK